jgi:hypothetical protein
MRPALAFLIIATTSCGGSNTWPEIVQVRDVSSAGGAPSVSRVRDLGNFENLPIAGSIGTPESDGVFVVGEHVLIEGSSFGKLPTLLIGGRPAGILARTDGGGLIARIPDGVPAGKVAVEVSHPNGKNSREIEVKRYGLVAQQDANAVYVIDVGPRDATVTQHKITVENPRIVRFSGDGGVAYVATGAATGAEGTPGGRGKIAVIATGAAGGPKLIHESPLDVRIVVSMAVAERGNLMIVVGENSLQLLSLKEPRTPAPYREMQLPPEIVKAGVVAADLDPAGRTLALLLAEGNQLVLYDVSSPESPRLAHTVSLLPDARVPLVRDVRFSVDGEAIWVVSGDNAMSVAAGKQPTRLTVVSLEPGPAGPDGKPAPAVPKVKSTASVGGASAPLKLALSRGQPLASGTTIRTPPEKAAVFLSGIDAKLLQIATLDLFKEDERRRAVQILRPVAEPGMVVRTDLEGGGGPLFTVPYVVSALHLSPDSQVLVGTATNIKVESGGEAVTFEFGVVVSPLWGKIEPRWEKLGDMQPSAFKPPFSMGHVRIQP